MSTFGGPNIIKNDLILSLDAGSTRSFRGEPTTNRISNASTMTGWSNYYRTISTSTFITEFGTTGYRFINQPSWNGILRGFNLVNTGTYTFSAWFKYIAGSPSNNGATVYISNYGGGDTATGINKNLVGVWQRISRTVNVTSPTNVLFYLISYGGVDNGTGNPDFSSWEVTMPQIEQKPYPTPFVNGTRGTTVATGGGWADLSGNNNHGELVNGPIFNSNNLGSIEFDGVNDYVQTNGMNNFSYTNGITVSLWHYNIGGDYRGVITNGSILDRLGGFDLRYGRENYFGGTNNGTRLGCRITTLIGNETLNIYSNLNEWHQYIGTYDNNTVRVYKDGQLFDSIILNGGGQLKTINNSTTIGLSPSTSEYLNGRLGNVKIYSRALSPEEILQNYNATKGRYGL